MIILFDAKKGDQIGVCDKIITINKTSVGENWLAQQNQLQIADNRIKRVVYEGCEYDVKSLKTSCGHLCLLVSKIDKLIDFYPISERLLGYLLKEHFGEGFFIVSQLKNNIAITVKNATIDTKDIASVAKGLLPKNYNWEVIIE